MASETFSAMTISGGLANDTINLVGTTTLLSSSVYGGGATGGSSDGADSINLGTVSSSFVQPNAGSDTINITATTTSSTVRGGKSADFVTFAGSVGLSYVSGDLGGDTLTLGGAVASGTSVWGGSTDHQSEDSADSLIFGTTVADTHVQGNGGADTISLEGAVGNNSSLRGGKGNDLISYISTISNLSALAIWVLTPWFSTLLLTKLLSTVALLLQTLLTVQTPSPSPLVQLSPSFRATLEPTPLF